MSGTKFYTQAPGPEAAYPWAVIEARIKEGEHGPTLAVLAPEEFRDRWPTVGKNNLDAWVETAGPARMLTAGEWRSLTAPEED